jgi:hypothetical protein
MRLLSKRKVERGTSAVSESRGVACSRSALEELVRAAGAEREEIER